MNKKLTARQRALKKGYKSGFEEAIQKHLRSQGCKAKYEPFKIPYIIPISQHTYTPDFVLPNGIIIETKGRWDLESRKKHELILKQHPHLDLRFVFSNSNNRIRKGSKTRYADICNRLGILYADKFVPEAWIKEKPNKKSLNEIKKIKGDLRL